MKQEIFIILLFSLSGCSISKKTIDSTANICDRKRASSTADQVMKKAGHTMEIYNTTIIEEDTFFLIEYTLIPHPGRRGGGGEIKISKETCKVIDKKFYQ